MKWYRKAADQGKAGSQFNVAFMYELGEGVAADLTEAVKWYRKAAEQGHAEAQHCLGRICCDHTNKVEGIRWLRLAAEQNDFGAQFLLGQACAAGDGLPQDSVEATNGSASPRLVARPMPLRHCVNSRAR